MKKLTLLTILSFFFVITSNGQNLKEFKSLVEEISMTWNMPNGLIETPIVENDDMTYEYAIKYPDKEYELRYAIRPITYKKYANDTIKNTMEGQREFRNGNYRIILKTVMLNVSGGKEYEIQVFDSNAVKKEFNADWGAVSALFYPNSDFGKGYKNCQIVTIHKKDVADAYFFYLSNTKENFSENMESLFHSLQFK